ncbi:MAG: uroporphyrinogen decarboxylase [Sandaracinaceae bacterium]|nr:uroporphyrinogen decarboxylase [Sandaracinaceae bacterium]
MAHPFLDACWGKATPYTPVWFMRQAGRYQPEYRALRSRFSFMELCKTPSIAAQIAVSAAESLGVDAAILFSDILVILEALGIGFEFTKGEGPCIRTPLRDIRDVERIPTEIDPNSSLHYVMEAIQLTKEALGDRIPLIGFSGAPFTLASYLIEGGSSRDHARTKAFMYSDRGAWRELMTRLAEAVKRYLLAQIDAGVDCIQLFDSWVGALSPEDYTEFVQPYLHPIFEAIGNQVPVIHFATGNPSLLPLMRRAGGHVIGIDHRASLPRVWQELESEGPIAVQGNLDPALLLGDEALLKERTISLLEAVGKRPGHIFNLGHGILPSSDPQRVRMLVDLVHEESNRIRNSS